MDSKREVVGERRPWHSLGAARKITRHRATAAQELPWHRRSLAQCTRATYCGAVRELSRLRTTAARGPHGAGGSLGGARKQPPAAAGGHNGRRAHGRGGARRRRERPHGAGGSLGGAREQPPAAAGGPNSRRAHGRARRQVSALDGQGHSSRRAQWQASTRDGRRAQLPASAMEENRVLTIVIARHVETSSFSPTQIWAFLRISVIGRTSFLH